MGGKQKMKQIKENSEVYNAIYDTICDLYDEKITMDGPTETTEQFVKTLNDHLRKENQ